MTLSSAIKLIPIKERIEENSTFSDHPDCKDSLPMSIEFYKKIGFEPPWIGYYASIDNELVGSGAFKGRPVNNQVEIAYGVFPQFQNRGIGARICRELVLLAQRTDQEVVITARTFENDNFSARILLKNNFKLRGIVNDPEDGDVWDWEYQGGNSY